MVVRTQANPKSVMERLLRAMNEHDVEVFLECIDPDYQSEQPLHPDRAFQGREQVRENWSGIFSSIPDFRAEILRCVSEKDQAWTEWHWSGTGTDGKPVNLRGMTVFGIEGGRIKWGRLYMEPVEETPSQARPEHRSGPNLSQGQR